MRVSVRLLSCALALVTLAVSTSAQEHTRTNVPSKYKWNLADLYSNEAAWRTAKVKALADIPQIAAFKGRIGSSRVTLADALEKLSALDREVWRLYLYASLTASQDAHNARYRRMRKEAESTCSQLCAQAAYIEPEVLSIPSATLAREIALEPRLRPYTLFLQDIERRAPHAVKSGDGRMLTSLVELCEERRLPTGMLARLDIPYRSIRLNDGVSVLLDQAAYNSLLTISNRADREKAEESFFQTLGGVNTTFGTIVNEEVQDVSSLARSLRYSSSVAYEMDVANIPAASYTRLIEGVNKYVPVFHRYLKLRKRMLGVDQLRYYDLHAPFVDSVELTYSAEDAQALVHAALAPLGEIYQSQVRRMFNQRWIDWYPANGKDTVSYSSEAAYEVHPYTSLNFNGKYSDVSVLAREVGHAMQSALSNEKQHAQLSRPAALIADVASSVNEMLLIDYMLKNVKDYDTWLVLLGNYLESIETHLFRSTELAEFELRVHETSDNRRSLTANDLDELYVDLVKRYYGHDRGITVVDDGVAHEWSTTPQLYVGVRAYQDALAFTIGFVLAKELQTGNKRAQERYLALISSGDSEYQMELFKRAGLDIMSGEPLDRTMIEMTRVMDAIEAILAKRPQ